MKLCLTCKQYFQDEIEDCPTDHTTLEPVGKDPLIGSLINDKYSVESVIGKGSTGVVYKAKRVSSGEPVAVKVFHKYLSTDQASLERFFREAETASRLHHPHIITLWESGTTPDGQPYFIMDYLQGVTLAAVLKENRFLFLKRAYPIIQQVCEALSEAHKLGVIHRDLKPDNILLQQTESSSDYVKVLDFGIGEFIHEINRLQPEESKLAAGSPAYMSPEQCQGHPLDPRSDIYSMAVVIFEMLTGSRPFMSDDVRNLMFMQVTKVAPSLSMVRLDLQFPPALEKVIAKALSKNPFDRQQTVQQFWDELDACWQNKDAAPKSLPIETVTPVEKPKPIGRIISTEDNDLDSLSIQDFSVPISDRLITPLSNVGGKDSKADLKARFGPVPEELEADFESSPAPELGSGANASQVVKRLLQTAKKTGEHPAFPSEEKKLDEETQPVEEKATEAVEPPTSDVQTPPLLSNSGPTGPLLNPSRSPSLNKINLFEDDPLTIKPHDLSESPSAETPATPFEFQSETPPTSLDSILSEQSFWGTEPTTNVPTEIPPQAVEQISNFNEPIQQPTPSEPTPDLKLESIPQPAEALIEPGLSELIHEVLPEPVSSTPEPSNLSLRELMQLPFPALNNFSLKEPMESPLPALDNLSQKEPMESPLPVLDNLSQKEPMESPLPALDNLSQKEPMESPLPALENLSQKEPMESPSPAPNNLSLRELMESPLSEPVPQQEVVGASDKTLGARLSAGIDEWFDSNIKQTEEELKLKKMAAISQPSAPEVTPAPVTNVSEPLVAQPEIVASSPDTAREPTQHRMPDAVSRLLEAASQGNGPRTSIPPIYPEQNAAGESPAPTNKPLISPRRSLLNFDSSELTHPGALNAINRARDALSKIHEPVHEPAYISDPSLSALVGADTTTSATRIEAMNEDLTQFVSGTFAKAQAGTGVNTRTSQTHLKPDISQSLTLGGTSSLAGLRPHDLRLGFNQPITRPKASFRSRFQTPLFDFTPFILPALGALGCLLFFYWMFYLHQGPLMPAAPPLQASAETAFKEGHLTEALAIYEKRKHQGELTIVEADHLNQIYVTLARRYGKQGRYNDALALLRKAHGQDVEKLIRRYTKKARSASAK